MAKKDKREAWQVIEDLWAKLKEKNLYSKFPLAGVDEAAGLKRGTCSAIFYGKVKTSVHKEALIRCEKGIK